MSIAWATIDEADAYFSTRLSAECWTVLDSESDGTTKLAALTTAQRDLESSGRWEFPEVTESIPATDAMKCALYEQALFRLTDEDIDARAALKSQGVTAAGIVSETYNGTADISVSTISEGLLRPYLAKEGSMVEWVP